MALHRDIYWVGRQWAATGFGVQAIDQRLQGAFDIEPSRLWDDGLQARVRRYAWLNGEDFDKALMIARQRFPAPAEKELSLVESVLELIRQPALGPSQPPPRENETGMDLVQAPQQVERPRPAPTPPPLQLRVEGQLARFVPQWRVRR